MTHDNVSTASENTEQRQRTSSPDVAPRKRGFGAMDRAEVRKLAQKGGIAAHRAGTAHEFNSDEARAAGRKGGIATHSTRRERAKDASGTTATEPKKES